MAYVNIENIMPGLLRQNKPLIQKILKEEDEERLNNRSPKIFISHKTSDKCFAKAIIDFLESLGVRSKQIFCSSIPGYGVTANKDFIDTIKEQYQNYKTFILIIHSKEYYNSPICMNELGAAFLASNSMFSFLTKDCNFEDLKGAIKPTNIMFQAGNSNTYHLLDEFKSQIQSFFQLKPISEENWRNIKNQFLISVMA